MLRGGLIPLVLVVFWSIGSHAKLWSTYIIPSPVHTLQTAYELLAAGLLLKHVSVSMLRVVIGFSVAFALAFSLGVLSGLSKKIQDYTNPVLEFVRHIPPLATVPIIILWFGIGELSKIVVIVLAAFFPVYLNTVAGVAHCDPKLVEVGRTVGFNRREVFSRIILPASLPNILVGMRLGLGYSWRALIGAEFIAAAAGIGYMILDAEQLSRPDVIIVGIITIGLLGAFIDILFLRLTKYLAPWQEVNRGQNGWD